MTDLSKWLSPNATKLLRMYSDNANKQVPHPLDQERWRRFLIEAHREKVAVPDFGTVLREWLVEQDWSDERAEGLAIQFECARDLLDDYDREGRTTPWRS